jgi:hypothetical protein
VAHVCHVVKLFSLQGYIDSNLGDTHRYGCCLFHCCHSVEVLFHSVHMRLMVLFNYDYLVVEINDTKNG